MSSVTAASQIAMKNPRERESQTPERGGEEVVDRCRRVVPRHPHYLSRLPTPTCVSWILKRVILFWGGSKPWATYAAGEHHVGFCVWRVFPALKVKIKRSIELFQRGWMEGLQRA